MPIFLLPFLVGMAISNHQHKKQIDIDQQRLAIEQKQYDLSVAQSNETHSHHTVKRGVLV